MSANLCLIAWNEPIGTPNCSPLLRVLERDVEDASGRCRRSRARARPWPPRPRGARRRRAARRFRARGRAPTATPSSVDVGDARGSPSSVRDRRDVARRRAGTTTTATPSSPVGAGEAHDDRELVGRGGFDHEALRAARARARRRRASPWPRRRPGRSCRLASASASVPAHLAARDRAEEARLLLGRRRARARPARTA